MFNSGLSGSRKRDALQFFKVKVSEFFSEGIQSNYNFHLLQIVMNAFTAPFPRVQLVGYLSHLGQVFWRLLQSEELGEEYHVEGNTEMRALAFVLEEGVVSAFNDLQETVDDLQSIFDYVVC